MDREGDCSALIGGWGVVAVPPERERLCCSVHGFDGLLGSLGLGKGPWSSWSTFWSGCQNRESGGRDKERWTRSKQGSMDGPQAYLCGPGRKPTHEEPSFHRGLLDEEVVIQVEQHNGQLSQVHVCCVFAPVDPSLPPFVRTSAAALTLVFSTSAIFLQRCRDIPVAIAPKAAEELFRSSETRGPLQKQFSELFDSTPNRSPHAEEDSGMREHRGLAENRTHCIGTAPLPRAGLTKQLVRKPASFRKTAPYLLAQRTDEEANSMQQEALQAADVRESLSWACRWLEQGRPSHDSLLHLPQLVASRQVMLGLRKLSPPRLALALAEAFSLGHGELLQLLTCLEVVEAASEDRRSPSRDNFEFEQSEDNAGSSESARARRNWMGCGLQTFSSCYPSHSLLRNANAAITGCAENCEAGIGSSLSIGGSALDRLVPDWYLEADLKSLVRSGAQSGLPQWVLRAACAPKEREAFFPMEAQLAGMKEARNLRIGEKDLVLQQQTVRRPDSHMLLLTVLPFVPVPAPAKLSSYFPERVLQWNARLAGQRPSGLRELKQFQQEGCSCHVTSESDLLTFSELFQTDCEIKVTSSEGLAGRTEGDLMRVLSAAPRESEWVNFCSVLASPSVTFQLLPRFVFINTTNLDLEIRQAPTGSQCKPVLALAYNLALASERNRKAGSSKRNLDSYTPLDEYAKGRASSHERHFLDGATPILRIPQNTAAVFHFADAAGAYAINIRIASKPLEKKQTAGRGDVESQDEIFDPLQLPHPSFEGLRLYDVLLHQGVLKRNSTKESTSISGKSVSQGAARMAEGASQTVPRASADRPKPLRRQASGAEGAAAHGGDISLGTRMRLSDSQGAQSETLTLPSREKHQGPPSSLRSDIAPFSQLGGANRLPENRLLSHRESILSASLESKGNGCFKSRQSEFGSSSLGGTQRSGCLEEWANQHTGRRFREELPGGRLPIMSVEPNSLLTASPTKLPPGKSVALSSTRRTVEPQLYTGRDCATGVRNRLSLCVDAPPAKDFFRDSQKETVFTFPAEIDRSSNNLVVETLRHQPHVPQVEGPYEPASQQLLHSSPDRFQKRLLPQEDSTEPDHSIAAFPPSNFPSADRVDSLKNWTGAQVDAAFSKHSAAIAKDSKASLPSPRNPTVTSMRDNQQPVLSEVASSPCGHLSAEFIPASNNLLRRASLEDVSLPFFLWTDALFIGAPPSSCEAIKAISANRATSSGAQEAKGLSGRSGDMPAVLPVSASEISGDAAAATATRSASQSIPLYDCMGNLFAAIVSTTTNGRTASDEGVSYVHFSPAQVAPIHVENHMADTPVVVTPSAPPCFSTVDSVSAAAAASTTSTPAVLEGIKDSPPLGTSSSGSPPVVVPPLQARPMWLRRALPLCPACEAGDIAVTRAQEAYDSAIEEEMELLQREGAQMLERYRTSMMQDGLAWQGHWWNWNLAPHSQEKDLLSGASVKQLQRNPVRFEILRGSLASTKLAGGLLEKSQSLEMGSHLLPGHGQKFEESDDSDLRDFMWPPESLQKVLSFMEGVTLKQATAMWRVAQAAAEAARLRWPTTFKTPEDFPRSWGIQGVQQWYKIMKAACSIGAPPKHSNGCPRRFISSAVSAKTAAAQRSGPAVMEACAVASATEGRVNAEMLQEKLYVRVLSEDLSWVEINLRANKCLKVVLQRPRRSYYLSARTRGSTVIVSVTPVAPPRSRVNLEGAPASNGLKDKLGFATKAKRNDLKRSATCSADGVQQEAGRRLELMACNRRSFTRLLRGAVCDKVLKGKLNNWVRVCIPLERM